MIDKPTILTEEGKARAVQARWADTIEGLVISARHWWLITWTAFVGLIIGIIPGAGASIAAFVAYQQARTFSKHPELFGTGIPEGVLAPESSNNGVTSGTLVPLMAIGVPGGSTAAVMMVVLQYQGIVLGPRLFIQNPELAYGVFISMVVAYLFMIPTILPLARYLSKVTLIPTQYLAPLIIGFTIVGSFAPREYIFDMGLALVFGIIGYIARKTGYHVTAILIGIILGPIFERYLMRALQDLPGGCLGALLLGHRERPVGHAHPFRCAAHCQAAPDAEDFGEHGEQAIKGNPGMGETTTGLNENYKTSTFSPGTPAWAASGNTDTEILRRGKYGKNQSQKSRRRTRRR